MIESLIEEKVDDLDSSCHTKYTLRGVGEKNCLHLDPDIRLDLHLGISICWFSAYAQYAFLCGFLSLFWVSIILLRLSEKKNNEI